MRNASPALAGSGKWHWMFIYKLKNLMLSPCASNERSSVHHFFGLSVAPPSPPPPLQFLWPQCHRGWAWTESNVGTGPDKCELINQYREHRQNNICWNRGGGRAIREMSADSQWERRGAVDQVGCRSRDLREGPFPPSVCVCEAIQTNWSHITVQQSRNETDWSYKTDHTRMH